MSDCGSGWLFLIQGVEVLLASEAVHIVDKRGVTNHHLRFEASFATVFKVNRANFFRFSITGLRRLGVCSVCFLGLLICFRHLLIHLCHLFICVLACFDLLCEMLALVQLIVLLTFLLLFQKLQTVFAT